MAILRVPMMKVKKTIQREQSGLGTRMKLFKLLGGSTNRHWTSDLNDKESATGESGWRKSQCKLDPVKAQKERGTFVRRGSSN